MDTKLELGAEVDVERGADMMERGEEGGESW